MITYVILIPGDEVVGYIRSAGSPSLEAMADHLATVQKYEDRDALLMSHPGLILGFAPLH